MEKKTLGEIRSEMGISRAKIAHFASTSEVTESLYEASPAAVGKRKPATRMALDLVREILGEALRRLEDVRKRFGVRKAKEAHEAANRDVPASGERRRRRTG